MKTFKQLKDEHGVKYGIFIGEKPDESLEIVTEHSDMKHLIVLLERTKLQLIRNLERRAGNAQA